MTRDDASLPRSLSPRDLVAPKLRPFGFPAGVIGRSLGVATFMTFMFMTSCAGDPTVPMLGIWFLVFFLFSIVILVGPSWVQAGRSFVALDEGGVRATTSGYSTYYPFELVGPGEMGISPAGIPCLILKDRTERPFLKIPLLNGDANEAARGFLAEYERRRVDRPDETPRSATVLERRGRPLKDWVAALASLGASASQVGYRAQGVDPAELEVLVMDRRYPAELRAAAAYTWLATKKPAARPAVQAMVTESAPPLVVLLVGLFNEGEGLVSTARYGEIERYLDNEDMAMPLVKA